MRYRLQLAIVVGISFLAAGCAADLRDVQIARAGDRTAGGLGSRQPHWPSAEGPLEVTVLDHGSAHLSKDACLQGGRLCNKNRDDPYSAGPDASTPFVWSMRTIVVAVGVAACALLANAAGIGGGPFYVPAMNVGLGFDLKLCTGLSHSIVVAGAIASVVYGLIQPSPLDASRPLIDIDIAFALIPAMLFGVSFGVLVNPSMPEWLQTILLGVLLVVVTRKTYKKGCKQWQDEAASKAASSRGGGEDDTRASLLESGPSPSAVNRPWKRAVSLSLNSDIDEHISSAHTEELEDESAIAATFRATEHWFIAIVRRIPWIKLAILVALWGAFLALQLKKAQHGNCTAPFAVLVASQAVLLAAVTAAFVYYQSRQPAMQSDHLDNQLRKLITAKAPSERGGVDDPQPSTRNLAIVVGLVAVSGFVAGLLGIGGALIFNPFMLSMGVHPQVVASTAVLIILFGSSSISLSFLMKGMLNVSYVMVYAPIACIASLIGVTFIGWAVRKSGRASIIVLMMSAIIAAGTIATLVFGGLKSYHEIQAGEGFGFKPFCQDLNSH